MSTSISPLDLEDVMTVKEVAVRLKIQSGTVSKWCNEGMFPHAYKAGRVWRIPRMDVEDFIKKSSPRKEASS